MAGVMIATMKGAKYSTFLSLGGEEPWPRLLLLQFLIGTQPQIEVKFLSLLIYETNV